MSNKIFDRYAVAELRKEKGLQCGLGLYFCREVSEAHGGDITYEPGVERGSQFVVSLPLKIN